MNSLILYFLIVFGYFALFLLKKDKLIIKFFDFSPIVVIILSGGALNEIKDLHAAFYILIGISTIIPFIFIFLLSKRRLAINGHLICKKCKQNLPKIEEAKLFDKRTYGKIICEKCIEQKNPQ